MPSHDAPILRRGVGALLLTLTGAWSSAPAQLLDLRPAATVAAPPAGSGAATLALVQRLAEEADRIRAEADDRPEVAQARAAVRSLAGALLRTGEQMGADGSARIVLGRTIADSLEPLDRALAAPDGPDRPRLELLSADARAGATRLEAMGMDADRLLRDILAPLLGPGAGPAGHETPWSAGFFLERRAPDVLAQGAPLDADLARWSATEGIEPATLEALRALDATLSEGAAWLAYARSSAAIRVLVREAARVLEARAWLEDSARLGLARQFDAAALRLTRADERADGLEALDRLARLARVMADIDRLDGIGLPALATRRARTALAPFVSAAPGDAQAHARTLAALERLLGLALARADMGEDRLLDRALVRQLRPAWRAMVPVARRTEEQLVTGIPPALRSPDPLADPAIVSVLSVHQRALEDLRLIARASAAIAMPPRAPDQPPEVEERFKPTADRILRLAQDLSRPEDFDGALGALRAILERLARYHAIPGEADLRAALDRAPGAPAWTLGAWSLATGNRVQPLLDEIDRRRAQWLREWNEGDAQGEAADAAWLDAAADVMAALNELTPTLAMAPAPLGTGAAIPRRQALEAWPGWHTSDGALAALVAGAPEAAGEATGLLLVGGSSDLPRAVSLARALRDAHAGAILAARLARQLEALGPGAPADSRALLLEIGTGPPLPGSWMGRHRTAIADVCRYAEEIPAAEGLGEAERVAALRAIINARAIEVLGAIDIPDR